MADVIRICNLQIPTNYYSKSSIIVESLRASRQIHSYDVAFLEHLPKPCLTRLIGGQMFAGYMAPICITIHEGTSRIYFTIFIKATDGYGENANIYIYIYMYAYTHRLLLGILIRWHVVRKSLELRAHHYELTIPSVLSGCSPLLSFANSFANSFRMTNNPTSMGSLCICDFPMAPFLSP